MADDYESLVIDNVFNPQADAVQKRQFGVRSYLPPNVTAAQYQASLKNFIQSQQELTDAERGSAVGRVENMKAREHNQASEDQIKEYLEGADKIITQKSAETLLVRNFFNSIFPGTFRDTTVSYKEIPDGLKEAVSKGFTVRLSAKDNKPIISISTAYMFSPSQAASKYDRALLRDARSMVKKLSQIIRLVKSGARKKNDLSFSQAQYEKRARYNQYKYQVDPYARISLAKQRFSKYGSLSRAAYEEGIARGTAKMKDIANKIEEQSQGEFPYGNIFEVGTRAKFLAAKAYKKAQQIKKQKYQDLPYKVYNANIEEEIPAEQPAQRGQQPSQNLPLLSQRNQ